MSRPTVPSETPRIAYVSDLHVLKKSGLVPPGWRLQKDRLAKVQEYLWHCWTDFVAKCPPLETLVINGDIPDGDSPSRRDPIGATSDDWNDQIEACEETLAPLMAKARSTYIVRGTPYHEGKSGDVMEAIARRVGAVRWADGGRRYSGHILTLRWHGLNINISHHNTRGWMWLGGATSRIAVLAAAAEAAQKYPKADIIVRSDLHTKVLTRTLNKWVCFTPAWTMPDLYAIKKMEAVRAHLATDIGAVVMSLHPEDGIGWRHFEYPLFQLPITEAA